LPLIRFIYKINSELFKKVFMGNMSPKASDFKASLAPAGFTNINDLFDLSAVSWLHPVQSLYGRWGGRVLILGQDYNGLNNLRELQVSDLKHDAGFETNKNLIKIFGDEADALYANFFWFIKDGWAQEKFSARKDVIEANLPIFNATVNAMKNLTHIFPMGELTTKKALNIEFNPLVSSKVQVGNRSLNVMPIPHLGSRGLGNFSRKNGFSKAIALEKIKHAVTTSLSGLI
jgi:hypothetical protein